MDLSEVWKHLILHRSQTLYAAPHGNKTLEMSNFTQASNKQTITYFHGGIHRHNNNASQVYLYYDG